MRLLTLGLVSGLRSRPSPGDELPMIDLKFKPGKSNPVLTSTIRKLDATRESQEMLYFADKLSSTFERWRQKTVELVKRVLGEHASLLQADQPEQQVRVKVLPPAVFPEKRLVTSIKLLEGKRQKSERVFLRQALSEFGKVFSTYKSQLTLAIRSPCSASLVQLAAENPSKLSDNLNLRLHLAPDFAKSSVAGMVNAMEERRDVVEDNERQAIIKLTGDMIKAGNDKIREILRIPVKSSLMQIPTNPELQRSLSSSAPGCWKNQTWRWTSIVLTAVNF